MSAGVGCGSASGSVCMGAEGSVSTQKAPQGSNYLMPSPIETDSGCQVQ